MIKRNKPFFEIDFRFGVASPSLIDGENTWITFTATSTTTGLIIEPTSTAASYVYYVDAVEIYQNSRYVADVVSYSDYYPYGMQMPGRNGSSGDYRYGFNGMEADDEVKEHKGTSYTTHFRQLDPRVGRWLSVDPKASAWESPYVSMGNNPILYNDVKGDTIRAGQGRTKSAWIVKGWLQLLTNDKLSVDERGLIYIVDMNTENADKDLKLGTQLIRDLISDDNFVTIKLVAGKERKDRSGAIAKDKVAASDGRGSNYTVNFNRFTTSDLSLIVPSLLKDLKTGKVYWQESSDKDMELAHELIHAFYGMKGQRIDGAEQEHKFKDDKGRTFIEYERAEELETTGVTGNRKYSENKIRREHKRDIRVSYQSPPRD